MDAEVLKGLNLMLSQQMLVKVLDPVQARHWVDALEARVPANADVSGHCMERLCEALTEAATGLGEALSVTCADQGSGLTPVQTLENAREMARSMELRRLAETATRCLELLDFTQVSVVCRVTAALLYLEELLRRRQPGHGMWPRLRLLARRALQMRYVRKKAPRPAGIRRGPETSRSRGLSQWRAPSKWEDARRRKGVCGIHGCDNLCVQRVAEWDDYGPPGWRCRSHFYQCTVPDCERSGVYRGPEDDLGPAGLRCWAHRSGSKRPRPVKVAHHSEGVECRRPGCRNRGRWRCNEGREPPEYLCTDHGGRRCCRPGCGFSVRSGRLMPVDLPVGVGYLCFKHGGFTCSATHCVREPTGKVILDDAFGPAGYRCREHTPDARPLRWPPRFSKRTPKFNDLG